MRTLVVSTLVGALLFVQSGNAQPAEIALEKGDRLVFLGDSITAFGGGAGGYVSLIKRSIDNAHADWGVETINAGVGGNKVADLQARLQESVLDKKPSIVFIYIGINDVWHWFKKDKKTDEMRKGSTKEEFEAGLRDIIGRIKASGAQVVLCTASVIGENKIGTNATDKMLDEYCDISRKVAADTQVTLVDLRKAFSDYLTANNPKNQKKGILTKDQVHLNAAGNKLVAEQMLKILGVQLVE